MNKVSPFVQEIHRAFHCVVRIRFNNPLSKRLKAFFGMLFRVENRRARNAQLARGLGPILSRSFAALLRECGKGRVIE